MPRKNVSSGPLPEAYFIRDIFSDLVGPPRPRRRGGGRRLQPAAPALRRRGIVLIDLGIDAVSPEPIGKVKHALLVVDGVVAVADEWGASGFVETFGCG